MRAACSSTFTIWHLKQTHTRKSNNWGVLSLQRFIGYSFGRRYWCGLGVFHAGVEVYGVEYAFGGHDYECSGIFATNPRDPPGAGMLSLHAGHSAQSLPCYWLHADTQHWILTASFIHLPHFKSAFFNAVVFRETVYMGDTDLTQAEVLALVQKMGSDFRGNRYHLLQRNCNHFATDLCHTLVGKPAPYWVGTVVCVSCRQRQVHSTGCFVDYSSFLPMV